MAHDWGHIIRQVGGELFGVGDEPQYMGFGPGVTPAFTAPNVAQVPAPQTVQTGSYGVVPGEGCDGMSWTGGTPPKGYKVVNYCGQGVLRKIRRRRRRRLLTASDKGDIAAIVGLVGKGQLASSLINRGGC